MVKKIGSLAFADSALDKDLNRKRTIADATQYNYVGVAWQICEFIFEEYAPDKDTYNEL